MRATAHSICLLCMRVGSLQVLTYGIASAAVLRLVMILLGSELIESWQPVLLVFAGILLLSSYKLLSGKDEEEDEDLDNNAIVKLCRYAVM